MAKRIQLHKLVQQADRLGRKYPLAVTPKMARDIYDCLNRAVFSSTLTRPRIIIRNYDKRGIWGECEGYRRGSRWGDHYTRAIRIERHWPNMKKLIAVMAHEMVHQYEWDWQGTMTHGTNFWAWQPRLTSKGIRLCVVM